MKFEFKNEKPKEMIIPKFTTDESILSTGENGIQMLNFNMSDYVEKNYKRILDLANSKNQRAVNLIITIPFLYGMLQFVSDHPFPNDYLIKWNRIVYDYYRAKQKDQSVMDLFIKISIKINNKIYMVLKGLGNSIMSDELCTMLAVSRYSSSDERRCIKRLTRMIQGVSPSIMTEQMITDIYSKTCSDSATNLFCTVMLDRFDIFYSSDENYVYSTVNLAILDILEQALPVDGIYKVLSTYLTEKKNMNVQGRFLLRSINVSDYPRINSVIDHLEHDGYTIE